MKGVLYYPLAGFLVLASVPIYRSILSHRPGSGLVVGPSASSAVADQPLAAIDCSSSVSSECVSMRNGMEAMFALREGRAKCVAGRIYRVYDHVIEPWPPGDLGCDSDSGLERFGGVGGTPTDTLSNVSTKKPGHR
jgi:hypothetical protein